MNYFLFETKVRRKQIGKKKKEMEKRRSMEWKKGLDPTLECPSGKGLRFSAIRNADF